MLEDAQPQPRKRSTSMPLLSLELMAPFFSKIGALNLAEPPMTRERVLKLMELNPSTGKSHRILAALLQYGLLESKGDGLALTDLGLRFIGKAQEEDLRKAFNNVEVFRRVRRDLGNNIVNEDNCAPLFLKAEVYSVDAFDIFEDSARYANLLDGEGRFINPAVQLSVVETPSYRFGIDSEAQVTVQFFGEVSEKTIDYLCHQLRASCAWHNLQEFSALKAGGNNG